MKKKKRPLTRELELKDWVFEELVDWGANRIHTDLLAGHFRVAVFLAM